MKIILEVTSNEDFDYEYFVRWLNNELENDGVDLVATLIKIDKTTK